MDVFSEISLILLVALVISALMRFLKQPLLIGYILTGFLVGPYFLNFMKSTEVVELFSQLGITALLFIVGLGLSPKVIKELGLVSLVTGVGQVLFTSLFGYILSLFLGFQPVEALYIAIALTFSSTIIILKLLSDKGDVNKLYGRISIGFLLVQDLIATVILVVISSITTVVPHANLALELMYIVMKGFVLLLLLFGFANYLVPYLKSFIGKSQEFLFIAALAWGIGVASLYHALGLSIEIGALVAGVTLSVTPFSLEISSRLKPLRDFFIILFFILLGYQMTFDNWQALLTPTFLFSIFILVGNPLIVVILMNLLGYTRKTGFHAGLTVAQISEFSLILVTLGKNVGHLSQDVLSMVTLVGIITISGSTYLILYSEKIFKKIEPLLKMFEFRKIKRQKIDSLVMYDALIFGYRRAGPEFAHAFREMGFKYLVVDFNPATVQLLDSKGIEVEYGDASDIDFLEDLPLREVKFLVSTIPDYETNMLLLSVLRQTNETAVVVVITDSMEHAAGLYEVGATHVVLSHYIGAHYAANIIMQNGFDQKKYEELRNQQIKYIKNLNELAI
ncbi:cation:proton antiporter [Patescibacteria group bacterium]